MALTAKLHSSFWSDEDVQQLDPAGKLAIVWVLTNKDMNNAGHLKIQKRQFEFDTGLSISSLQGALKGLARGFCFEESPGGLKVLALNYIKYQYGEHALTLNNNIMKNLCVLTAQMPDGFRDVLLERYEGLARGFRMLRPLEAPCKGVIRDQNSTAQYSTAQKVLEGMQGEGGGQSAISSLQAPEKHGISKNGGENFVVEQGAPPFHVEQKAPVKSGLRYDLAEEVLRYLNERAGTAFLKTHATVTDIAQRLYEVGQDVDGVKKMIGRQVSMWSGDGKMSNYLRPATLFEEEKFGNYYGQRELALPAGDAAARAIELQRLIDESRANRSSVAWSSQATEGEKEQLKNWRAELRGMKERAA